MKANILAPCGITTMQIAQNSERHRTPDEAIYIGQYSEDSLQDQHQPHGFNCGMDRFVNPACAIPRSRWRSARHSSASQTRDDPRHDHA